MQHTISSLGELLDNAGTTWRVFDMGRRIQKIDKQTFSQIENNQIPYPFPLQQHAFLAIQFWNSHETETPYIWFLKMPLDEQSKLVQASRNHFSSMVIEALGNQLTGNDEAQSQLDNNPYVFTPNANKLAAFNAIIKKELKQSASAYYEHVELYFSGKLGFNEWQQLGLQGIADFSMRLTDPNQDNLIKALDQLPQPVVNSLAATLEHSAISVTLTEALYVQFENAVKQQNSENIINYLRMMSNTSATGILERAVAILVTTPTLLNLDVVLTLTGRCWHVLENHVVALMDYLASEHDQDVFAGIFADLVAIPSLRPHMLAMIRMQNRSEALSRAIGKLFQQ
ncbi:hypothetical protein AN214_02974 [Pseudoalteromonas sp. P1-9]|uniref:DUF3549 family protein n=1 Tax=Pseudoalteromonas sp. P1-9 TaxID=1710354 RepID=UPI0006D62FE8|nr:DUF3549 family protein [Pseudoalteromonas sp. P1-9]KPV94939.1 hypothetical protein AN214_02974 [Pseudoalteromonas sp. P1-9]